MIRIEKRQKQETKLKIKGRVKGETQECPFHTGYAAVSRAFGPMDSRGRLSHIGLCLHELGLFRREDDFGVEEGARYSGGDGEQFPLSGEDFDLAGA